MPQRITPATKTRVITQDGEVHMIITLELNININGNGQVTASATPTATTVTEDDDAVDFAIPDFTSGEKLDFGQKVEETESKDDKKGWNLWGK